MRIEQRIGRIDRYGQKSETVAIVNFVTPGTVDADIYERRPSRIGVFEHAVGGSEEILATSTQELHDIGESFYPQPRGTGAASASGRQQYPPDPRGAGAGDEGVRTVRFEFAEPSMAG